MGHRCDFNKCLSDGMCHVIGMCMFDHPLLEPTREKAKRTLMYTDVSQREKVFIDMLQKEQPPKVSGKQIKDFEHRVRGRINSRKQRKNYIKKVDVFVDKKNKS